MPDTTVDLGPQVVNYTGLIAGEAWDLEFGFGSEETPENLTGRTVTLILKGVEYVLTGGGPGGVAHFAPSASDTAAFRWPQASYLTRIDGVTRQCGLISIGNRVRR